MLQAAKSQLHLVRGAGLELNGIAFDTTLAAWLLRPGARADNLGTQVYDTLGERLQESDPNQLVPEVEPASPATEAWYVLRVADYLSGEAR